jgi:murein DD-endopeptidase MepM/ murein hydrolase activator NlpD
MLQTFSPLKFTDYSIFEKKENVKKAVLLFFRITLQMGKNVLKYTSVSAYIRGFYYWFCFDWRGRKYMGKISKYSRRIRLVFGQAVVAAGVCIMAFVPWSSGFSKAEENYYTVMVNGKEMGTVADAKEAEEVYTKARIRLEDENEDRAYVDASLDVVKNNAVMGKYTESSVLEEEIYQELCQSEVTVEDVTYTVNVGDTSVVLASLEEVAEVVNIVKEGYDDSGKYEAVITDKEDERFGTAECELVQASIEPENKPMVMAAEDGAGEENADELSLAFGNEIEVIETYNAADRVLSVDEAAEVLRSALQVIQVKEETYTESIAYTTEYVTDDTQYEDYQAVIQEGQAGLRTITAQITYDNGVESSRTILENEVTVQPVNQVITIGTKVRPEYALPLANPVISDVFGPRWGTMHRGMDFSCSTGTNVLAAASGIVAEATYKSDYGYTVLITHTNGTQTRYAHMSQLLVKTGDVVTQGDVVGLSGSTGDSTGPHLHFEIIVDGERVDPQPYLYP